MKPSHERLGSPAEILDISEIDGIQLVQDFRSRKIASIPKEFLNDGPKPANQMNKQEVDRVRRVFKKNRGIRHQTAEELDCSITWLDEVISTHKLEK